MAKIYANLIRKGKKTLADVPEVLREEVREILVSWGMEVSDDTAV